MQCLSRPAAAPLLPQRGVWGQCNNNVAGGMGSAAPQQWPGQALVIRAPSPAEIFCTARLEFLRGGAKKNGDRLELLLRQGARPPTAEVIGLLVNIGRSVY